MNLRIRGMPPRQSGFLLKSSIQYKGGNETLMRTKKILGILLSLALVLTLSSGVPAKAMVEVPVEDGSSAAESGLEQFTLEQDGLVGVGFFCSTDASELLRYYETLDEDDSRRILDAYVNSTISEFGDEVDFIALNPDYEYTLSYKLKGEECIDTLDKETWKWKVPSNKLSADKVTITVTNADGFAVSGTLEEFNNAYAYLRQEPLPSASTLTEYVDERQYVKLNVTSDKMTLSWDYKSLAKRAPYYDFGITKIQVIAEPRVDSTSLETLFSVDCESTLKGSLVFNFEDETYEYDGKTAKFNMAHNREITVLVDQYYLHNTSNSWEVGKFTYSVPGVEDRYSPSTDGEADEDIDFLGDEITGTSELPTIALGTLDLSRIMEVDWGNLTDENLDDSYPTFYDKDGNVITDEETLKKLKEEWDKERSATPTPTPDPYKVVNTGNNEGYVQTGIEASSNHTLALVLITLGGVSLCFVIGVIIVKAKRKEEGR